MCDCTDKKGLMALRDAAIGDFPLPTRVTSNGEFDAPDESAAQRAVREVLSAAGESEAKRRGLTRREFFRTASGLACAFLAMNAVHGGLFEVAEAEAADDDAAQQWRARFADQFVFDDQVHFVHPGYTRTGLLELRRYTGEHNNPAVFQGPGGRRVTHADIQFQNFVKEIYLDSDTDVALLSGAPADEARDWFLPNRMKREAADAVNTLAGSTRLLPQAVFAPGMPGWLDDLDAAIGLGPASWKGYTVGDPQAVSKYTYRLDDEKLVYPAYEKMLKAGITTVTIHKGLMPADYLESAPMWRHATVDDLPKAAKDWPELTFVIYHAAIRPGIRVDAEHLAQVEASGYIPWVTDLARIPEEHGVANVAADLGTVFAASCVQHPRHAAMILGTLIQGLGADNVYWGTDSVWHGSPQWQLEAFRRLEIPEDLRERFGYAPLGGPRSVTRDKVLGLNAARLYGLDPKAAKVLAAADRMAAMRAEYVASGRRPETAAALLAEVRHYAGTMWG